MQRLQILGPDEIDQLSRRRPYRFPAVGLEVDHGKRRRREFLLDLVGVVPFLALELLMQERHRRLLGAGIPICEHMTGLASLPDEGFRFSAVPPKVKGMGTFPVRAYAVLG